MYWKAWDGASQFKLVKVSLEDMVHTITHPSVLGFGKKTTEQHCVHQTAAGEICSRTSCEEDGCDDSHRKYAQQLLPVGDVWYGRLCAVEEAQEDAPSVSSVPVDLLCRLLGQTTHRTVHPA